MVAEEESPGREALRRDVEGPAQCAAFAWGQINTARIIGAFRAWPREARHSSIRFFPYILEYAEHTSSIITAGDSFSCTTT